MSSNGADVYYVEGRFSGGRIMKTTSSLSTPSVVYNPSSTMWDLALDETNSFIYYTNDQFNAKEIGRVDLEGTNKVTVTTIPNSYSLRDITVDPENNKLWYTVFSTDGTTSGGSIDIKLPNLNTGVYIVQLSSEKGKLNKKIVLE